VHLHRHKKFDLLRGIGAIAVLLAHAVATYVARIIGPDHPVVLLAGTIARHAVLVFFLLSGYLITQSILANVRRNGRLDVVEYLAARIARIYPPLIGAICVVLGAWALIHGLDLPGSERYGRPGDLSVVREAFTVNLKDVPLTLLMSGGMYQADGPLWYLYVEFHIYIIAMFAAMAVGTSRRRLWGVVALAQLIFWTTHHPSFAFYSAVWALGAATSLAKERIGGWTRPVAYLIGIALIACGFVAPQLLTVGRGNPWVEYSVQMASSLVYVYVFFLSDRFGNSPPEALVKTGSFSYSLYVVHFPLLLLAYSLTQDWMGASLARSLAVTICAIISVLLFSAVFAKFFEDQRRFKPRIRATLRLILTVLRRSRPSAELFENKLRLP